ncbi:MAG: hypothetical protein H0A76_03530 [Candidatus Thiodubiliella endoseptemdiera]|uniref:Uncharacterized protein n=1 Tax=Candidatus Thiodubiliella endoseptemdiera TaxID=2738886 RepID=A0A853F464_9GAMM|nr:hypothetical protein [Candidatus Thiodubiliella endoseptemdiera]
MHNLVAEEINDFLTTDKQNQYNNLIAIAQLYNHLETEIQASVKQIDLTPKKMRGVIKSNLLRF